ncbi:MAG: tetratricopeptide repeat protein [Acidobacteriota bacterium]
MSKACRWLVALFLVAVAPLSAQTPGSSQPISDARLEAIAIERDSARAWVELARRRAEAGGPAAGLDAARRALELAPNSEDALAMWARLCLGAGQPIQALTALEALARIHPKGAHHVYLLGVTWLQVGDLVEAIDVLERAIDLQPDQPRPKIALGLAWNAQKRYAEAGEVLEAALRVAPDEPEAMAAYAEALEGLGELDAAQRFANRTLERIEHETAFLVLGMVAMKRGDFDGARAALERAVALGEAQGSAEPKAHYQLSLAYARLGERELSERHREHYQASQRAIRRQLLALRGQNPPEDP